MTIPGMMVQEFGVPAIGDKLKNKSGMDGYSVKYFKADMDNDQEVLELQGIETRGLMGEDIVVTKRETYSFLERYFVIVQYLERNPQ